MTHTRILLALALVAAAVLVWRAPAQTAGCASSDPRVCEQIARPVPRIPRPRNGQCPVCGTQAQPYRVRTCPDGETCPVLSGDYLSAFRRVDCEHCNTVFRQWAEGKEPKR
jgi:hypothetical protein